MADEKDDEKDRDDEREAEASGDDAPSASGRAESAKAGGRNRGDDEGEAEARDEAEAGDEAEAEGDEDDEDDDEADGEPDDRDRAISPEEQDRIAAREAEAVRREEERLAAGASEHEVAPITGMLGVERWVQFSFIALGGTVIFLADRLIQGIWGQFAEPDPTIVSGSAALVGLIAAFVAYRHPRSNEFVHEVIGELSKVTWPTRDETYYSTIVVIVTSVIAAVYTGVFDALWSAFTDLVYNV